MTSAQDVVERVVALLGWVGDVPIMPGGDGTDGSEARIVHDAEAWWFAIAVEQPSGAALARTGTVDPGGTHAGRDAGWVLTVGRMVGPPVLQKGSLVLRAARSCTRRAAAVLSGLVPGAVLVTAALLTAAAPALADASIIRGQGRDACTRNYVCLYDNWDYNASGSARILRTTEDISHLDDYNFNDVTSSVVNNSRYLVRIYPDYDFKGVPVTLLPGESISFNNGNGFNDVASSVQFLPYTIG